MPSIRFKSMEPEHFLPSQALVQAADSVKMQLDVNGSILSGSAWILQSANPAYQGNISSPPLAFGFYHTNGLNLGGSPNGVVYTANNGGEVWVANGSNLSRIHSASSVLIATYSIAASVITYNSTLNHIWASVGSNLVKINAMDGSTLGTYALGSACTGLTFDATHNLIWTYNSGGTNVIAVDAATGAISGTYPTGQAGGIVGATAYGNIVWDSSNDFIWVVINGGATVVKLDAGTGSILQTISIPNIGCGVTFDPSTNSVWVGMPSAGLVKINSPTGIVVGTFSVGSGVQQVCYDYENTAIWAGTTVDTVIKVATATGAVLDTYSLNGDTCGGLVFDPSSHVVWAARTSGSRVQRMLAQANTHVDVSTNNLSTIITNLATAINSVGGVLWNASCGPVNVTVPVNGGNQAVVATGGSPTSTFTGTGLAHTPIDSGFVYFMTGPNAGSSLGVTYSAGIFTLTGGPLTITPGETFAYQSLSMTAPVAVRPILGTLVNVTSSPYSPFVGGGQPVSAYDPASATWTFASPFFILDGMVISFNGDVATSSLMLTAGEFLLGAEGNSSVVPAVVEPKFLAGTVAIGNVGTVGTGGAGVTAFTTSSISGVAPYTLPLSSGAFIVWATGANAGMSMSNGYDGAGNWTIPSPLTIAPGDTFYFTAPGFYASLSSPPAIGDPVYFTAGPQLLFDNAQSVSAYDATTGLVTLNQGALAGGVSNPFYCTSPNNGGVIPSTAGSGNSLAVVSGTGGSPGTVFTSAIPALAPVPSGLLYWLTGANAGTVVSVSYAAGTWTLSSPLTVAPGDTFAFDSLQFNTTVSPEPMIGTTITFTSGVNSGNAAVILGYSGGLWTLSIPNIVGGPNVTFSYTNNVLGTGSNSGVLVGGTDAVFTRTAWFDQPTQGFQIYPGQTANPGTVLPNSGAPTLGTLPDNLTLNGTSCSYQAWAAKGWMAPLTPPGYANRPDFGTVGGTSYAETAVLLGDLKGMLTYAALSSSYNPNGWDLNVHFVAFQDATATALYGFPVQYLYAVAYFGNQDAVIDNTLVTAAAGLATSTSYGPNAGAQVSVSPTRAMVWDTPPSYCKFFSDIFLNFPNAPVGGGDIGLTAWPAAPLGATIVRATPTANAIVLAGPGNGLTAPYVLQNGTAPTDILSITGSINAGNGFFMSLVYAFTGTAFDQVLFDAGYVAGSYATYTGTLAGTATPVTITANNIGASTITSPFPFNGATSITDTISAWNTAYPGNQLTLVSGDGTQVPSATVATFTAGVDSVGARIWIPAGSPTLNFAWGNTVLSQGTAMAQGSAWAATFMRANNSMYISVSGITATGGNAVVSTAAGDINGSSLPMTLLSANNGSLAATNVALYGGSLDVPATTNQLTQFGTYGSSVFPLGTYALMSGWTNFWINYYNPYQASQPYSGSQAPAPVVLT